MTRFTYVLATFCAAALASAAALAGPLVAYGDEVILGPQSPPAEIAARLAPGMGNTLVAMADGRVCGWGQNFEGGLGRALDSSAWFSPDPACIDLPNGAAATAITSFRHAIALTADGDVYTWGAHSSGKLGIGPVEVNSFTPNLVTFPVSITATAVGAGADHSVALTEDGDIFTWGNNELGQLGNSGAGVEVDTPVKVAASGIEFAAVSSGWNHALAISRDGDVYAWGSDAMGQLGPDRVFDVDNDPENAGRGHPDWFSGVPGKVAGLPDHIAQVSAGADHSVALSENGDVYAWGSGQLGQLGNGATSGNYTTPVKINLPPIVGISAGAQYTVAWTAAGELYAWGANIDGNLGFGTNADVSTPHKVLGISVAAAVAGFSIQSYMRHTVAVDKDGRLVTWGNNDHTQLGDTSVPYDDQPRRVDGIPPIAYVAAGDGSTMAVSTGGELYAWGDNYGGVLGTDATEQRDVPTLVGGLSQVARVAIRDGHAVALDANADVWTWGRNGDGELGRVIGPDERPELVPDRVGLPEEAQKVTDLGAGSGFTMVLDADGQLWGWGANQPHLGSQVTPPSGTIQSREVVDIGLPERPVSGFAVDTGVGIALVDGTAYGLGHGESGQLGVDVTTVAVRSSVAIEGLGNRTIVQVDTTSGPRFAAGFTAAVDDEGTVWTLGRNASFQLGRQTDADGGDEADAVPGAVVGIPAIAAVSVGWTHAAALSRDGEVFAWGQWRHGNADTGNGSDIEWDDVKPVKVTGLPSRVVRIATGSDHTVALTEDGEVYTWGNNIEGQLGVASSNWSPDVRVTTLRMWESATTEPGIGDPDPCETSGEAPVLDGCEDPGTGDPDPCETSSEESVPEGCEDPGTGDPDPGDTNDPDTCDTAAGVSVGDSCEDPGTGVIRGIPTIRRRVIPPPGYRLGILGRAVRIPARVAPIREIPATRTRHANLAPGPAVDLLGEWAPAAT
ncbi:MAG: hypothetical protein LBK72_07975 [Bifidobacteriaceae bacterium]|jgi:alpha-tubulin suppressor-like RCC1 family protein|nr:hypothetical protein [Bifidobacteriaceae bacterium]